MTQDMTSTSFYVSVAGLGWYTALWCIGLLGCWSARRRYRQPRPLPVHNSSNAPGVSILRPLKGLDTNLYENLESTFKQVYPNYEILLSVADDGDQALDVVRDLVDKYPNVNAHIVIGEEIVGVNPKVNNLMRSYRQAANDILWVLDSNVMVDSGTLSRSVDALTNSSTPKQIGLVHHIPFAFCTEPRIGSRIEQVFLNTNHAKMYIAINTVAIESCVVGKSNLYRRSDLERVNGSLKPAASAADAAMITSGLQAFGRFLAEDNMIASALWKELGQRHDLSCDVARTGVANMSFADYVWRRVRWIRVRKHMVFAATLLEPLTECIPVSLIGAASLNHLFNVPVWIALLLHYVVWLQVDMDVYASLAGHPIPSEIRWQFLAAWVARETIAFPIWLLAMLGSEVNWRGNTYRIIRDGETERVIDSSRKGFGHWLRSWRRRGSHDYESLATDESGRSL